MDEGRSAMADRGNRGPPGLNSKTAALAHSPADLQVLREIDHIYFSSPKEFDASRYVLERAPCPADCSVIEEMFTKLKMQERVVSGKALHLISQQRDTCDREFAEIQNIRETLAVTVDTCRGGRSQLGMASSRLTVSTFAILANFRKRQLVHSVLRALQLLRTLRRAEKDVGDLMDRKDYEGAVTLILKCRQAAASHNEFTCVSALATRLQDALEMTEEQLDKIWASLCKSFDEDLFAKLRRAYALLDKIQVAMEQLHMHYISAVHENALLAVRPHSTAVDEVKLNTLYQGVPVRKAPTCLLNLCERLWCIMHSYYRLVAWHKKYDEERDSSIEKETSVTKEYEKNVNKEYIRQKLKTGLLRIWNDVSAKVSSFLKLSGIEDQPFEKFVVMLGILRRLTQIAEVFCGDTSQDLQDFIKTHSVAYLRSYHGSRMDELKLFLENEGWELCPVKFSFNLLSLQEFKLFKRHIIVNQNISVSSQSTTAPSDGTSSIPSHDDSVYISKYFTTKTNHTPFDMFKSESITNEDIFGLEPELELYSDESDDEPEELKKDLVDENVTDGVYNTTIEMSKDKSTVTRTKSVIVTNTTISVLRHCGQYLQMCRYLQPISLEVIMVMSQMFDYYFYTVHLYFTSDLNVAKNTLYSSKLNSVLKRISNNIKSALTSQEMTDSSESTRNLTIESPILSPHLNLSNDESLHALSERIVAVESVIFLARQFELMFPYLESLVLPHQRIVLETFRDHTLSAAVDLRIPVYMSSASKAVDTRSVLIAMSQVKWDVRDVAVEHSAYVDLIVRQLQVFALRLERIASVVAIDDEVNKAIWFSVSKFVVHLLVEGYSNATKCSNGGRGLMQLDYTQLFVKLEKISGIRPVPFQDYVDWYVKAYYLPGKALEEFIREHLEYSNKHMLALVACACSDNKRVRQELAALIEHREFGSAQSS